MQQIVLPAPRTLGEDFSPGFSAGYANAVQKALAEKQLDLQQQTETRLQQLSDFQLRSAKEQQALQKAVLSTQQQKAGLNDQLDAAFQEFEVDDPIDLAKLKLLDPSKPGDDQKFRDLLRPYMIRELTRSLSDSGLDLSSAAKITDVKLAWKGQEVAKIQKGFHEADSRLGAIRDAMNFGKEKESSVSAEVIMKMMLAMSPAQRKEFKENSRGSTTLPSSINELIQSIPTTGSNLDEFMNLLSPETRARIMLSGLGMSPTEKKPVTMIGKNGELIPTGQYEDVPSGAFEKAVLEALPPKDAAEARAENEKIAADKRPDVVPVTSDALSEDFASILNKGEDVRSWSGYERAQVLSKGFYELSGKDAMNASAKDLNTRLETKYGESKLIKDVSTISTKDGTRRMKILGERVSVGKVGASLVEKSPELAVYLWIKAQPQQGEAPDTVLPRPRISAVERAVLTGLVVDMYEGNAKEKLQDFMIDYPALLKSRDGQQALQFLMGAYDISVER
jgi:hypothetical protein